MYVVLFEKKNFLFSVNKSKNKGSLQGLNSIKRFKSRCDFDNFLLCNIF